MKKYGKDIIIIVIVGIICFGYAHINKMHSVFDEDVDQSLFLTVFSGAKKEFEQKFTVNEKMIDGVAIKIATSGEDINKINLIYSLEDETGNVIRTGELKGENLKSQKYNKLKFERIENTTGKQYCLKFHVENGDEVTGVNVFYEGNTIVLKYYVFRFDLETFLVAIALCIYVVGFMKILLKMFKE